MPSYPTHPFPASPSAQKHIPSITLGRFGQFTGGCVSLTAERTALPARAPVPAAIATIS
jgi:hypothetical protein